MKKTSFIVTALLLAAAAGSGLAANITVSTTADAGDGSLRAAVEKAGPEDIVIFDIPARGPGYDAASGKWAITLTNGEIKVSRTLVVKGGGKIILDGNNTSRILSYDSSYNNNNDALTLDGLTFRNGRSANDGGAVQMRGRVTLSGCTFTANAAKSGGALYAVGTVTITNCIFTANAASGGGGSVNARYGRVTATSCTFAHNTADADGGAVYTDKGSITAAGCTFAGNTANGSGGAVYTDKAFVTVESCTFSGNKAESGSGGAVWAECALTATACAFTGNKAETSGGAAHAGEAVIENCTFTDNAAHSGGAVRTAGFAAAMNSAFSGNHTGGGFSGAIHADRLAYLYHATVVDSVGAGVYLSVDSTKAFPRLYAYNSVIVGNGSGVQAGFGNDDGITAIPQNSITGSSLIEGIIAGVTRATVFGKNEPDKGVTAPRAGGRADKAAGAIRAAGLKVPHGMKPADVVAALRSDISGAPRPAAGKVSYGVKE